MICGGALKLIDFDQAVFSAGNEGRALRFGTPGFAAPELYRNEAPDERADIYAIGALLFYMGTGEARREKPVWRMPALRAGWKRLLSSV